MNTNKQAPECCPFCGAARKAGCGFAWFECGTMTAPADNNRRDQTPACATAERERLTRERDQEAAKADHLCVYSTSLETANRQLTKERDDLVARVKRLQEAGDAILWYFRPKDTGDISFLQSEAIKQWNKAKEAKP